MDEGEKSVEEWLAEVRRRAEERVDAEYAAEKLAALLYLVAYAPLKTRPRRIVELLLELRRRDGEMPVEETRKIIRNRDAHPVVLRKLEELRLIERPRRTIVRLTRDGSNVAKLLDEVDPNIVVVKRRRYWKTGRYSRDWL